MLRDAFLPASARMPVFRAVERPGIRYSAARWTPEALGRVVGALREGAAALWQIPDDELLAAWGDTVAIFLRTGSLERRALDPPLARLCGLSREGLWAGLEAVLGGVRREPAAALLARARRAPSGAGPVLAVLASNLPGLAVQPLLPALLTRRPVLLKSPSAEPLFAPAFLAALARREPRLAGALAAVTWPGGEAELEAPVLEGVGTVLAYGERATLDDLARRAPGKVIGYGPQISLGVVGASADLRRTAEGLARDVALFDQRGCLSVAAVYTAGSAEELAGRLAGELAELLRAVASGSADPVPLGGGPASAARRRDACSLAVRAVAAGGHGDRRSQSGAPPLAGAADGAGPPAGGSRASAGDPGALAGQAPGGGPGRGGGLGAGAEAGGAGDLPLRSPRRAPVAGRHLAQRRDRSAGRAGSGFPLYFVYFPFAAAGAAEPLRILASCTSGEVHAAPSMRPISLPFM